MHFVEQCGNSLHFVQHHEESQPEAYTRQELSLALRRTARLYSNGIAGSGGECASLLAGIDKQAEHEIAVERGRDTKAPSRWYRQ